MTVVISRPNGRPEEVKLLGVEIDYRLTGAQMARADLVEALREEGFEDAIPKNPPTAKRALKRAIAEWAQNRAGVAFGDDDADQGNITGRKKLIREIRGTAERGKAAPTIYALVEEGQLGGQLGLKYATSYRFRYDPETPDEVGVNQGSLTISTTAFGTMAYGELGTVDEEIRPIWEKYRGLYLGGDLSLILIDIIHSLRGISVQSGSGVWFVPADRLAAVDRLERLVGRFQTRTGGEMPSLRIRENIDWPRTRAALAEAAMDALQSEIRKAATSLERFEEQEGEKPGSVRPSSVTGFVADLVGLEKKAKFYEQTVGLRNARNLYDDLNGLGQRAFGMTEQGRAKREAQAFGGGATPVFSTRDESPERNQRILD